MKLGLLAGLVNSTVVIKQMSNFDFFAPPNLDFICFLVFIKYAKITAKTFFSYLVFFCKLSEN